MPPHVSSHLRNFELALHTLHVSAPPGGSLLVPIQLLGERCEGPIPGFLVCSRAQHKPSMSAPYNRIGLRNTVDCSAQLTPIGKGMSDLLWPGCSAYKMHITCVVDVLHVIIAAPNIVKHKAHISSTKDAYLCFHKRALACTQI